MGWMDEFPMMHPDGAGAANRLLRDAAIRRRVCVQDGFSDERHTRAGGIRDGGDIIQRRMRDWIFVSLFHSDFYYAISYGQKAISNQRP